MASRFLEELAKRVVVFDGAMGTSIHARHLDVQVDFRGCENCTEVLVLTRPEVIAEIHESFLAAGADAVETDTFGANRLVLGEFGLADECFELNRRAAGIARAACDRFATPDHPRFVVGSIGPGTRLITLGQTTWDQMLASYREQTEGLLAGGVDALIIETCQDLLQAKCALRAVLEALDARGLSPDDVPVLVSLTIESTGTMLMGTEVAAAATALAGYPICALGLNCATGPAEMGPHVRWLGRHWPAMGPRPGRALAVMPNAGLPVIREGRTDYPLSPETFVEAMLRFVEEDGVRIVGGCCGTTPEHIRQLRAALDARGWTHASGARRRAAVRVEPPSPGATSLYSLVEYRQENSILIIGERMNASGSRTFRRLLEAEDFDGIVGLAREQIRRDGAHVLDLNVDDPARDSARDMREIVRRLVCQVNAPLMLDSTQPATIEAGLRHAGGKCIINSANFEDGEAKFDALCRLARWYGAALVVGAIDEDREASMARTAERKVAILRRAHERATRVHGLCPEDIFFDPLVLPVSTGLESDRRSALETIEGVRRLRDEFPQCQTTVGLSNVSFGLKPAARVVLNSVFLHELRQAGLTSAILHFSRILPAHRIHPEQWAAATDVLYDRRRSSDDDPLQRFVALFEDAPATAGPDKTLTSLSVEERLRAHIINGDRAGLDETLRLALERYTPLEIINDHLLDGMKTVGELFGSGRMQLPFVLQSAEVMKLAVSRLEPLMERAQGATRGTIVLATVKGDVHDIGKNLVDIILSNNGYRVVNLGIKQPIENILRAWREHRADAVGMSGLLVKSVAVMEENLRQMRAEGITVPVLLGGAALTRHYCEGRLREIYGGPCYYGRDAFEGLRVMDYLRSGRAAELDAEIEHRLERRSQAEAVILRARQCRVEQAGGVSAAASGTSPDPEAGTVAAVATPPPPPRTHSDVSADVPIPTPPFWGTRVVRDLDLADVYPFINTTALFRGQWGVRKGALSDAAYRELLAEKILPVFERLKARCRDEGILAPAVVYGYFPCNSEGDDLIVWDHTPMNALPGGRGVPVARVRARERMRFRFPRQRARRGLCLADFFRPITSPEVDVLAVQCVTVGPRVSEVARALFAANDYTEYLYLHGLGVEAAEALAEFWHKRIREELGIADQDGPEVRDLFAMRYRGARYSFGYPACPDLADQQKLFELLRPERIGCALTENYQIEPEQSTSALVVHHPQARYFAV